MPPALRRIIPLAAAVLLWSAACVAGDDDSTFLPSPPGTASPFPFCPARPAGASTGPFPWSPPQPPPQSPPSPSTVAVFPQDPGFLSSVAKPRWLSLVHVHHESAPGLVLSRLRHCLSSGACTVSSAVAWLPLLAVFSAFLVFLR